MRLLQGIRVIELGGGIAGSYATKMFADYGAEVIKIEPPEGDETRRMAPHVGSDQLEERRGPWPGAIPAVPAAASPAPE